MDRRKLLVLAVGLSLGGGAFAQSGGSPARLRGKIDAVSADVIQLTLRSGAQASAKLAPNARIVWLTVAQLDEIKQGSYVGTAAVPLADGSLKALEVQVFPESMRGVGEGSRDWALGLGSSMTNGTGCRRVSAKRTSIAAAN